MKKILVVLAAVMVTMAGCRMYTPTEVEDREPNYQSYCQRIGDMAIGIEPFMLQDKTHYVFNKSLKRNEMLALNVSMAADGDTTYTVKKSDISAVDEDDNEYVPVTGMMAAEEIAGLGLSDERVMERELPDEITVSDELTQGFLYFDMEPNEAEARLFTVHFFAVANDGSGTKEFALTVDPYRLHMNPTEKWSSYYGGVTPCGYVEVEEMEVEEMEPMPEKPEMEIDVPGDRDKSFEEDLYK